VNVTPLHKCAVCDEAPGEPHILEMDNTEFKIFTCDACLKTMTDLLAKVRPVFDKMLEVGVHEQIASETMIFLLDKMDPT
jgi:hypothetical protein